MRSASQSAQYAVQELLERVASDLSMLADREIEFSEIEFEERVDRPVGEDVVHISYRFGIRTGGVGSHQGTLLVPLPDSIALAAYLMMASDEQVASMREAAEPDHAVKEAILEVGNFVAAASDAAMRSVGVCYDRVSFEGCQGVRAGVRPRLDYEEGDSLAVGRARMSIGGGEPAYVLAVLPQAPFETDETH